MFVSTASLELVRSAASTAHGATAPATWETGLAIGVAFLLMACVAAIVVLVPPRPPGHDSDEDAGSGPGGEGPGLWRPDAPRRPNGEPDWWPEFEQQFAAHVTARSSQIRSKSLQPAEVDQGTFSSNAPSNNLFRI